jgi:HEAT repeat protein
METRYHTLKDRAGLERQVRKRLAALDVKPANLGKLIAITRDRKRSESDRCDAAELLGLLEFVGTVERRKRSQVVRSLLRNMSEGKVKLAWCSAVSLGHLNSKVAVRPLMRVATGPMQSEIRRAAIYGLGILGDRRAASLLSHVLENPMDTPQVRGQAAEALATCGCRSKLAIAALTRAMQDKSVEIRFFSAFALGQCALSDGQVHELAVSGLQRLLRDRSVLKGFGSVAKEVRQLLHNIRSNSLDKRRSRLARA